MKSPSAQIENLFLVILVFDWCYIIIWVYDNDLSASALNLDIL